MRSACGMTLGILAVVAGCASSGSSTTTTTATTATAATASTTAARPAARRGSANLITEEEIAGSGRQFASAFEIVEALRPSMMRARGSSGGSASSGENSNVMAFVDEIKLGELSQLRGIGASEVKEIRYISATDATTKWGTGYMNGVIQVIRRK